MFTNEVSDLVEDLVWLLQLHHLGVQRGVSYGVDSF